MLQETHTQEQLKERLLQLAKADNICVDGYRRVVGSNRQEMIAYYKQMIDWCLERNYPDYAILQEHFSDCEDEGIYIGKEFNGEIFSSQQVYVFHNCKGTINVQMDYENEIIPMLYFANKCDMRVICTLENIIPIRVPLYIFGENCVESNDSDNAQYVRYITRLLK